MKCLNCEKETRNPKFCSRSCSATFNNKKRAYRKRNPCECGSLTKDKWNKWCDKCIDKGKHLHTITNLSDAKTDSTRRKILVAELGHQCQECKRKTWNGLPIALEIEHIDGNSDNNKRENLDVLCPNCHSQTPTYKGKNIGNGRDSRRRTYRKERYYKEKKS